MDIKLITKQTMYRNLKGKEICIVKLDTGCRAAIGLPVYGTFSGGLRGRQGGECKIVCVNRYCMNLLYAPYWGKQR